MRWPGLPGVPVALRWRAAVRRSYSAELIFWKARLTYGAMVLPDAGVAAKARKRDGEVSPCSLLVQYAPTIAPVNTIRVDHMRRRDFMRVIVVGAAGWPLSSRAQQPARAPLIGVLFGTRADDPFSKWFTTAFDRLMKERGSLSSPSVEIQYHFSGGDTDATQSSARELIGMRPAVIVANSNTSMAALHREATSIPVVFLNVSDSVGMGYVESLSRPGRSATGLTPFLPSLGGKWLSFLKELAPSIEDVGVIFNPEPGNNSGSFLRAIESAAPSFAIKKSSHHTQAVRILSAPL
jgi:hypothetical protein